MNKGAEEGSIYFVEVPESETRELIEQPKNENTWRKTMADVKLFQQWLTLLVTTKREEI